MRLLRKQSEEFTVLHHALLCGRNERFGSVDDLAVQARSIARNEIRPPC
jgi:hypothetical protein